MSEDNVTALHRATVVAARNEGEESAYGIAARYLSEVQRDYNGLSQDALYLRLDALRWEFEQQSNAARQIKRTMERRIQRAGMELRDDTSAR